ncbi:MAG: DUF2264 domain-containing protein [Clostridia bacterium]|nr:DUF2264 domain-containing protein [Clostridia bacterium]
MRTKQDYEKIMLDILNPLKEYFTPDKAYIKLSKSAQVYPEKTARIEAFMRPLWALGPYYRGNGDKDMSFAEIYKEGIKNGSNPFSPAYWGEITDNDQIMVEMAAMGLCLMIAPDTFFFSLSEKDRENLVSWLSAINDHEIQGNNWALFLVMVNMGLKSVGMPYREDKIEWALEKMDEVHRGGGWFDDGIGGNTDYYNPFAYHFYSLIYAKQIENIYHDRADKIKERAKEFAKDFIHWFDKEGRGAAYGRSLTYRFAQVAFWSALVYAEASPFSLGMVKGIINRNLEFWLSQPIFDEAGVLTVGYAYPNLFMSEPYNASGSPYWAMKAFLILALPENHPFFEAEEEELPEMEKVHIIKNAGMVVTNNDTHAVLYPARETRRDAANWYMREKYMKFAYSSKYGYSVPRSAKSLECMAPDSSLVILAGGNVFSNINTKSAEILEGGKIKLEWSPMDGVEVTTLITPFENSHKREHYIKTPFPIEAVDLGFAVNSEVSETEAKLYEASVKTKDGGVRVYSEYGDGIVVDALPATNLMSPNTKIPGVKYKIDAGVSKVTSTVYDI